MVSLIKTVTRPLYSISWNQALTATYQRAAEPRGVVQHLSEGGQIDFLPVAGLPHLTVVGPQAARQTLLQNCIGALHVTPTGRIPRAPRRPGQRHVEVLTEHDFRQVLAW